jgi:hypothetical protein
MQVANRTKPGIRPSAITSGKRRLAGPLYRWDKVTSGLNDGGIPWLCANGLMVPAQTWPGAQGDGRGREPNCHGAL